MLVQTNIVSQIDEKKKKKKKKKFILDGGWGEMGSLVLFDLF